MILEIHDTVDIPYLKSEFGVSATARSSERTPLVFDGYLNSQESKCVRKKKKKGKSCMMPACWPGLGFRRIGMLLKMPSHKVDHTTQSSCQYNELAIYRV